MIHLYLVNYYLKLIIYIDNPQLFCQEIIAKYIHQVFNRAKHLIKLKVLCRVRNYRFKRTSFPRRHFASLTLFRLPLLYPGDGKAIIIVTPDPS